MLHIQVVDFLTGEVAKAEGRCLDVEGGASGDDVLIGKHDAVIAHVAHAAEDDGLREVPGTLVVSGAYLAQDADERIANQGVNLIDEKNEGTGQGFAKGFEIDGEQGVGGYILSLDFLKQLLRHIIAQHSARTAGNGGGGSRHHSFHLVSCRLSRFHIGVYGDELAAGVQIIAQGQQAGGFSGLTGGMEDEVFALIDKLLYLFDIDAGKRVYIVMYFRLYRPGCIEKLGVLFHGAIWFNDVYRQIYTRKDTNCSWICNRREGRKSCEVQANRKRHISVISSTPAAGSPVRVPAVPVHGGDDGCGARAG